MEVPVFTLYWMAKATSGWKNFVCHALQSLHIAQEICTYRVHQKGRPPVLLILLLLLPLITEVSRWARRRKRQEHPHALLILLVLGIFPRADQLRKPRRCLEQQQIAGWPHNGPVNPAFGDEGAPQVEEDPDGLLGGEVRVPAVGPHVGRVEAAVKVFAVEGRWDFGGFLVGFFGFLVFCPGGECGLVADSV